MPTRKLLQKKVWRCGEVKTSEAKQRWAAYMRAYRLAHPEFVERGRKNNATYNLINKEQRTAKRRAYRAAHRDELNAYKKAWRAAHRERHVAYGKTYRERPGYQEERRGRLVRRYGLSQTAYAAMLNAQGGVCATCLRPPENNRALCIDHDHQTGIVRGLLCHECNVAIGNMRDDHKTALSISRYLKKHSAP